MTLYQGDNLQMKDNFIKAKETYKKYVAFNVRKFRENKSLTQKELAEMIGSSIQTIGSIERGVTLPQDNLIKISQVLNIPLCKFYEKPCETLDEVIPFQNILNLLDTEHKKNILEALEIINKELEKR